MNQKLLIAVVTLGVLFSISLFFKGDDQPMMSGMNTNSIPYQDAQAVALGKIIYQQQCVSCHGVNLEGQANWRQRGADGRLPAPPHDESGHTWHHPDGMLIGMVTDGIGPFAPEGYQSNMPAYREILSEQEILGVLAYIKSTWSPVIQQRHDQMSQ